MAVSKLGTHLRALRVKKRKSLKTAAPELGLSPSYLSKIENGKLVPPPETAERLAAYYETSVEDINALAGRLPEDIVAILQGHPEEVIRYLRERFSGYR